MTKTVTFQSTTAASFEYGNNLSKEIEKGRKIWYTIKWSIIPGRRFIEDYCRIVAPYYEEIGKLKKANDSLVKQRDYLLPRLMGGKLEV